MAGVYLAVDEKFVENVVGNEAYEGLGIGSVKSDVRSAPGE